MTVAELCGKSAVKKGEVRMDGVTSLAELSNASLSATYCIARVDVRVTDENGAEAISAFREGSCKPEDQYKMAMD